VSDQSEKRPSRLGLIIPFVILLGLVILYSLYWFQMASLVKARFLETKTDLASKGIALTHNPIEVSGYPFRLYVPLRNLSIKTKEGAALSIDDLVLEAASYDPQKWVIAARSDILYVPALKRLDAMDLGTIRISSKSLKASITGLQKPVPDFALDAQMVRVSSENDALSILRSADRLQFYTRQSKTPKALDLLLIADKAVMGGLYDLDQTIGSEPLFLHFETSLINDQKELWPSWHYMNAQALRAEVKGSDYQIDLKSPSLRLDQGGRIEGQLELGLSGDKASQILMAQVGQSNSLPVQANKIDKPITLVLSFSQGNTYLGPIKLSKSPQLIQPIKTKD
jgi:hypothetical protein